MLRIVGGTARGRRLAVPTRGTRPTSERAREGMFNTLATTVALDEERLIEELGPREQERPGYLEPYGDAVQRHHPGRQQLSLHSKGQKVLHVDRREDQAGEAGDGERVGEAGDRRQGGEQDQGGAKLAEHGGSPRERFRRGAGR